MIRSTREYTLHCQTFDLVAAASSFSDVSRNTVTMTMVNTKLKEAEKLDAPHSQTCP